ncbi:MAG UNVERIFIED_CONTAM: hypothetical protein LVR18_06660 [Planctomycetaceae bacterium]|jgi:hypothetical protein
MIISLADLKRNKLASGRPKDFDDLQQHPGKMGLAPSLHVPCTFAALFTGWSIDGTV